MSRKGIDLIPALLFLLITPTIVCGQEKSSSVTTGGYISSMQSALFEDPKGDWIVDNLLHNRLKFRIYAGSKFTFGMGMKNRLFSGDMVRMDPGYADNIGNDPGVADLSWNVIDENSILLNSTIDRLWIDYSSGIVQLRIGRQRINWGQTFVWNPNDIFNAYSYFDFDYAERPGSDAIRLQIYPSYSSTIELAVKIDSEDDLTAAGLVRVNKWGYDFQFLAGYVNSEDIVIGTGWSGAFGSTSFRGEVSWFQPYDNFGDTTGTGMFTLSLDRSFSNNALAQVQAMYCNNPLAFEDFESFYSGNLSAKDLAFSEFSLFGSLSFPIAPLFNFGISAIWYPELNGYFAGPTLDWSLAENVDFSFIWQHFDSNQDSDRQKINLGFLRFKYSF